MSFSSFAISLDAVSGNIVKTLQYDAYDLDDVLPAWVLRHEKYLPQERGISTRISSIIISDGLPDEEYYFPDRVAYVSYHHQGDPTIFEILIELKKVFEKLSIAY